MVFGLSFRTINDGQRCAIWSRNGSVNIVDGPCRLKLWLKRVEVLQKRYADHNSYLEVTRTDGTIEIVPGPCTLYENPVEHQRIRVQQALLIDASEALVVYKGGGPSTKGSVSAVERRVIRGPARFIPQADEWIHQFSWSGVPKDGSKTSYQPRANSFTHLKIIPTSVYHNVTEVRTNDDTLVTVKLMLFFDLVNIEKMLDATNDPIGDFINAASADIIAFCATLSYENFLNETHKLNELCTFKQLCTRASAIGYDISKVVFRGFQAGERLQTMHDNAIQERTRLRLLEETEAQAQRQADLKLHAEQRRAVQQAELATQQAQQKADLSILARKAGLAEEALADEAAIEKARRQHEAELEQQRVRDDIEHAAQARRLELEQARNAEQLAMMRSMKELGVDLTKVLVSQHEQPDRVIKLDTGSAPATRGQDGAKGLLGALQLNL